MCKPASVCQNLVAHSRLCGCISETEAHSRSCEQLRCAISFPSLREVYHLLATEVRGYLVKRIHQLIVFTLVC